MIEQVAPFPHKIGFLSSSSRPLASASDMASTTAPPRYHSRVAEALDAADGVRDGTYFGRPIVETRGAVHRHVLLYLPGLFKYFKRTSIREARVWVDASLGDPSKLWSKSTGVFHFRGGLGLLGGIYLGEGFVGGETRQRMGVCAPSCPAVQPTTVKG